MRYRMIKGKPYSPDDAVPEEAILPKTQVMDRPSNIQLADKFDLAENFVKKFYLNDLNRFEITKVSRSVMELSTRSNIKMFKISGLIFNKDENVQDRLNNVYSSLHNLNLSVVFMLKSDGKNIDFYIGTKTIDGDFQTDVALAEAFKKTFGGNFPGSEILPVEDCNNLLNDIMPEDGNNAVTSLTALPSLKDDKAVNRQYVQGIEKFVDTMQGEKYTVLIISDPISGAQIEQVKQGYVELYSGFSSLAEQSLTVSENQGINLSRSEMKGYTDTIGNSISKTQSFTKGRSSTKSTSTTKTVGVDIGVSGNRGTSSSVSNSSEFSIGVNAGIGNSLFSVGANLAIAATKMVASGISSSLGVNLGLNASKAEQEGESIGESESRQEGESETEQKSHAETSQHSIGRGISSGSGTSFMVKNENKSIKVFLECIDEHLKRLKQCENYGMWSSAAYFISPSRETSIISASAYKGIINGEGTSLESASMNTWYRDESTRMINKYLRHFTHPRLNEPDFLESPDAIIDVTPSTMLSTKELSIQCSVPYKSIPGVFVKEMVEFGRDIPYIADSHNQLRIGTIYHMGKSYTEHIVRFNTESLKQHTFITGATGSGKSNTVYGLISGLNHMDKNIPTLIIEPAKGEYKQVFGNEFNVYSTNPNVSELLRINPFKFEDNIHVLEHIDRLIDIFNVCWPMYAAMPAILKEAVENAYKDCGWNLNTSINNSGYNIYPCFKDLLIALRKVINSSDYSQEVKDNYTGSLVTRIKSLTNGLNGQIFTANEIDNVKLFEESTIIDLSRIGSSETKSMIMGIVIMRLQERRMSQGGINLPLRHVTVIEEAHNLLKRTSYEQSSEGANLSGKSVEMIANAIAEMRTYGEGFVIVDQAPGLLDMSVIRNTNTKIIMHLPDMGDRELVGKSASLTENQLLELAKIPTGVAAIYQNKWVEPVLCKVDFCSIESKEYEYSPSMGNNKILNPYFVRKQVVRYLLSKLSNKYTYIDIEELKKYLINCNMECSLKQEILHILDSDQRVSRDVIERLVTNLIDSENIIFKKARNAENINEWNKNLIKFMAMDDLPVEDINLILECIIHYRSLGNALDEENYRKWMKYMGRGVS